MSTQSGKGGVYARAILLIAVVQGFLFLNAGVFWGTDWPAAGVSIYLFLEAIFFGWLGYGLVVKGTRPSWLDADLPRAALMWLSGFVLTWVVVYGLFTFILHYDWPTIGANQALPVLVYQAVFVTTVEEVIFRGILPSEVKDLERWPRFPVLLIGTQVLFAVYHLSAYGGWNSLMVWAFLFGMIWVWVSRRWSIYWTMGSHLAWNGCVLGILSGGIT
jgi:membrane protease YdiL (CAAX protease family)